MKMNSAQGTPHPGNVLPKLENMNPELGDIPTVNNVAGHRAHTTYDKQRGRVRSRVAAKSKQTTGNMSPGGEPSEGEDLSSADEGAPSKKRRRSRKGSDRKYACLQTGCGKVYSRAEHLYRHQLNHNAKTIFYCDHDGCTRHFVRQDLCNRHKDRHDAKERSSAKSFQIDSAKYNPSPSINTSNPRLPLPPGSLSPEAIKTEDNRPQKRPFSLQHESPSSPFTPNANMPSAVDASSTPTSVWFSPGVVKTEVNRPAQHRHFGLPHENGSSSFAPTATMPSAFDTNNTPTPGWFPRSNSNQNAPLGNEPSSRSVYPMREHGGLKTDFHSPEIHASFSNASSTSEGVFLRSPTQPADVRYGLNGMQTLAQASPFINSSEFPPNTAGLHHDVPRRTMENDFAQQNYDSAQFMLPTRNISQPHSIGPTYSMPPADQSVSVEFNNYPATNNELFSPEYLDPSNYMSFFYAGGGEGYDRSPTGLDDKFLRYLGLLEPQINPLSLDNSTQQPIGTYSEIPVQFRNRFSPNLDSHGFPQLKVNSLLQPTLPEHQISNDKAQDLFKMIDERFNESEESAIVPLRSKFITGNRDREEHMLSTKKMQMYIDCFFDQFHPQIPILHKPTFTADNTSNLLLLAIMAIGAACLGRKHNYELSQLAALLSNFLAWHLRWEVFLHKDFRPPGKLWMFQTLLLLELYEKMYSDRVLHERAHLHHATTITLMRRGTSLLGCFTDSRPQSPTNKDDNGLKRQSPVAEDTWWLNFIEAESTRRAAYAAFLIDSTHATMFGHSSVMQNKELTLPLPCDENLWAAPTRDECYRLNSNIKAGGQTASFLSGLRDLTHDNPVQTDTFGRTILMAGLLNCFCQMMQRDHQQAQSLGVGAATSSKWRPTLRRAFDNWSHQYDNFLLTTYQKPYYHHQEELTSESHSVLYHLAHMAIYVDIVECQIYAHAPKVLGRLILTAERASVVKRWESRYHKTHEMRTSVYYALSFLKSILMPDAKMKRSQAFDNEDHRYKARDDPLLNRPWVIYYAALVVWCYGFAKEGPTKEPIPPRDRPGAQRRSMEDYLNKFYRYDAKGEYAYLAEMEGLNGNTGLLMIVSSCFKDCRWELLKEAQNLLTRCIELNTSGRRAS